MLHSYGSEAQASASGPREPNFAQMGLEYLAMGDTKVPENNELLSETLVALSFRHDSDT